MNIARSMAGIMFMVLVLSPLLFIAGETLFIIFIVIIPAIIKSAIAIIATKFQVTGSSVEYKYDFLTHKQNSFSVEKITKVTIIETLIDKLFKTCTIKFYSIGSGSAIVFKNIKKTDDLYEKLLAKV
ncbi:MAG: PH domain-containing protein [Patescibacteria group bacterium]